MAPPENRDPKPDEIISCRPYLERQLELIEPEVIVALGAHAARTLLETNKAIGKLRGQFHEYHIGATGKIVKLMPTYHPAYLLRNDMQKVMAELGLTVG
jgi:DNA polymerase